MTFTNEKHYREYTRPSQDQGRNYEVELRPRQYGQDQGKTV